MRKEEDVSRETYPSHDDQRTEVGKDDPMRFQYRKLSDDERKMMIKLKELGATVLEAFDSMGSSREIAIAKTRLEEAIMWSIKHLTR